MMIQPVTNTMRNRMAWTRLDHDAGGRLAIGIVWTAIVEEAGVLFLAT
jgi:hypothetical protein